MATPGGIVDSAAGIDKSEDKRIYGTVIAQVIQNCDKTRMGRVQIRLPWMPGLDPWARLSLIDPGAYFLPQIGDEVLVTFNRGDVNEPYIIGRAWNEKNKPKRQDDSDPANTRAIQSPSGHEVSFDEKGKKVLVKSSEGHSVSLSPSGIEIAMPGEDASKVSIDKEGNITLNAKGKKITLDAATIEINGTDIVIGKLATSIKIG